MHIDLNSCFATVEQQAHPLLRGKPLVIAAYASNGGCVLSPSIEAKKLGIKTGMRVGEAKQIYPFVVVRTPDPPKYRDVHKKFEKIIGSYSSEVVPKSIDEIVIDFKGTRYAEYCFGDSPLIQVGHEIKKRMRGEIGEWISCNIGISTNRFLAKLASNLHKPDGLDVIDHSNLREIYGQVELMDLNGINTRFKARLNGAGIFTPLEFLDASIDTLKKIVFKSIAGYYWNVRLRGWETGADTIESDRRTFGQSYALPKHLQGRNIDPILMKLTEKMARRLRSANNAARGIFASCIYNDWSYWHKSHKIGTNLYATNEFFDRFKMLLDNQPSSKPIAKLSIGCFDLTNTHEIQNRLFETKQEKDWQIAKAMDKVNDNYGEYTVVFAPMHATNSLVIDRIAFGN